MNNRSKRIVGAAAVSVTSLAVAMGAIAASPSDESMGFKCKATDGKVTGSFAGADFDKIGNPVKGKASFTARNVDDIEGKGPGVLVQTKDNVDGQEAIAVLNATLQPSCTPGSFMNASFASVRIFTTLDDVVVSMFLSNAGMNATPSIAAP